MSRHRHPFLFRPNITRNRLYDPRLGRFLERDPINDIRTPSPYVAFGNNPISAFDPMGMEWDVIGEVEIYTEEEIDEWLKTQNEKTTSYSYTAYETTPDKNGQYANTKRIVYFRTHEDLVKYQLNYKYKNTEAGTALKIKRIYQKKVIEERLSYAFQFTEGPFAGQTIYNTELLSREEFYKECAEKVKQLQSESDAEYRKRMQEWQRLHNRVKGEQLHNLAGALENAPFGLGEGVAILDAGVYVLEGRPREAGSVLAAGALATIPGGKIVKSFFGAGEKAGIKAAEKSLEKAAEQNIEKAIEKDVEGGIEKSAATGERVTGEALSKARNEFNAMRSDVWKAEAAANPSKYTETQLKAMREGNAPLGKDGFSMEIHHKTPLAEGGANTMDNFEFLSRTDHRLGGNYKIKHPNLP